MKISAPKYLNIAPPLDEFDETNRTRKPEQQTLKREYEQKVMQAPPERTTLLLLLSDRTPPTPVR